MFMTSRNGAEQLTLLCPRPLPELAGPCFQDYFRPSSWTLPLKTKTKHFHPCHLFFPFFLFMLSHSVVSDSLQPYGLYSPPVSSVHGISQAKILEWIAISASGVLPHPGIKAASPAWQFSFSAVSDSLRPHGLQHTRPPCSSPTPQFKSINSLALNAWQADSLPLSHLGAPPFFLADTFKEKLNVEKQKQDIREVIQSISLEKGRRGRPRHSPSAPHCFS